MGPNPSLKLTLYGSRRWATLGAGGIIPSAAERRLPPQAAWLERYVAKTLGVMRHLLIHCLAAACLAVSACGSTSTQGSAMQFHEAEIRLAEKDLEIALSSPDPLAWVEHYTEDAVFVAPGAPAVQGREALTRMAKAMRPLSAASIQHIKTDGSGSVAAVYAQGSWVNGAGTATESTSKVRLIIVWRKGSDGRWRIAQELLHPQPASQ